LLQNAVRVHSAQAGGPALRLGQNLCQTVCTWGFGWLVAI